MQIYLKEDSLINIYFEIFEIVLKISTLNLEGSLIITELENLLLLTM